MSRPAYDRPELSTSAREEISMTGRILALVLILAVWWGAANSATSMVNTLADAFDVSLGNSIREFRDASCTLWPAQKSRTLPRQFRAKSLRAPTTCR
jgi:hypothetical protein